MLLLSPPVARRLFLTLAVAGAITSSGADPHAVCMQCEIYFRGDCRFKKYGQRNCFYQHHQTEEPDRAGTRTEEVSDRKED